MSDPATSMFPPIAFVKVRLLQGVIYKEDRESWEVLKAQHDELRHYFRQIGQELIVDDADGFAFIRQVEMEGARVPRLGQRRPLGYTATLLMVCLREELARFDSSASDSARLVLSRTKMHTLVGAFLKETNNQVKDAKAVDSAIGQLQNLGFLRHYGTVERDEFEVMRIVKARLSIAELETIRDRLINHAKS